ncbi:MAG: hypothetical protein M3P18_03455 [Actinomycetota bacterium]|nr:hypothetical protein [Actinomycetota bacterium]
MGIDARTHWIKRTAQQGLIAELVAGRLGSQIGAAPDARIVRLTPTAAPIDGSANHLLGIGVGICDQPGTENLRHINNLRPDGTLDPATLDPTSRALVVAFQTWLGVGDTQILVDLRNGRLQSVDHGDWCSDPSSRADPIVVETPGVPSDFAKDKMLIEKAVEQIEDLGDGILLRAVSQIPSDLEWNSATARRLALAEWLAWRRDRLREVMRQWWNDTGTT